MYLQEVRTSRDKKAFLDVARTLYKNDPVWVCPFDKEINAVFDPAKNSYFSYNFV